jgi:hypothetical protein
MNYQKIIKSLNQTATEAQLLRMESDSNLVKARIIHMRRSRECSGFQYLSSGSESEKAAAILHRLCRSCPKVSASHHMAAAELTNYVPAGSACILACAALTVSHMYLLTITEESGTGGFLNQWILLLSGQDLVCASYLAATVQAELY